MCGRFLTQPFQPRRYFGQQNSACFVLKKDKKNHLCLPFAPHDEDLPAQFSVEVFQVTPNSLIQTHVRLINAFVTYRETISHQVCTDASFRLWVGNRDK